MNLNSFGATIARIEGERLQEAKDAIAAGWTPDQHPATCCPPDKTVQPKRGGRSLDELERLRTKAKNKAKWWTDTANRSLSNLANILTSKPEFDHGHLNLPLAGRQREADRTQRLWLEAKYQKERAAHFERLESKYAQQIQKRTT